MNIITKKELTRIIQHALDLGVLNVIYEDGPSAVLGKIVCNTEVDSDNLNTMRKLGVDVWVYGIWEGKYEIDMDSLNKVLELREKSPEFEDVLLNAKARSVQSNKSFDTVAIERELV